MGKRKITIEKIECKKKLQVTFSKRRKGLFKKAADLSLLSDANIGIVVFSPAGRPYTFGPVDSVIDRYIKKDQEPARVVKKMETEGDMRFWLDLIDLDDYHCVEKLQTLENELEKLRENVLRRAEELASSSSNVDIKTVDHTVVGLDDFSSWLEDELVSSSNDEQTVVGLDDLDFSSWLSSEELASSVNADQMVVGLDALDFSSWPSSEELASSVNADQMVVGLDDLDFSSLPSSEELASSSNDDQTVDQMVVGLDDLVFSSLPSEEQLASSSNDDQTVDQMVMDLDYFDFSSWPSEEEELASSSKDDQTVVGMDDFDFSSWLTEEEVGELLREVDVF